MMTYRCIDMKIKIEIEVRNRESSEEIHFGRRYSTRWNTSLGITLLDFGRRSLVDLLEPKDKYRRSESIRNSSDIGVESNLR